MAASVIIPFSVLLLIGIVLFVGVPFFFNRLSPTVDARRRGRDDDYFFAECSSGLMSRYRRLNRRLPADPRCKFCLVPFAGVGRVLRIRPSRKNPNFCMGCFEMAPIGGTDMDVGVLFADLRGFTSWCEHQPPSTVERALNRFYAVTTAVITETDGLVDKLVGDEVMGLFLTAFQSLGDRTCDLMVTAAEEIMRRLHESADADDRLPVGIGLNFGIARVGNVGVGDVKDFTAVGDVVNTAARLQACAAAGEIVMAEAVYERVRERHPALMPSHFDLKGKADQVAGRILAIDKRDAP
jgi:adenylate cyclase